MKGQTHKGILVKWKDDQGFGFIKSESNRKEVFIHISSIPKQSRRPKIGDTIIYELKIEGNGKLKADSARIQGVKIQSSSKKTNNARSRKNNWFTRLTGLIIMGIFAAIVQQFGRDEQPSALTIKSNCEIKGNISQNSGRKYYHIPGMQDYESTVIRPEYGEKWFCTEQEAISQGWVKAPN